MNGIFGSPCWTRTNDLRINSPSLYRLSYQGTRPRLYTWIFSNFLKLPEKSEATEAYLGSGRRQSQIKTTAIQLLATARTHIGVGVSNKTAAHIAIMTAALYLAFRLTNPPAAQFCSMGPKSAWRHNHVCNRGELRMAAQPAININTVVGSPGMKTPAIPSASEVMASTRNSQRRYQWRTTVGCGTHSACGVSSSLTGEVI